VIPLRGRLHRRDLVVAIPVRLRRPLPPVLLRRPILVVFELRVSRSSP
jgi:hypothetical protein